jgi:hypothetical protein
MNVLSGIVVVSFCLFLIGLAVMIVARPSTAKRFLGSFASSAKAHYIEQGLRLLVGAAMVNLADAMRYPNLFRGFGWLMVGTTIVLLLVPWRWHQTFATRVMPPVYRWMKLFALGAFALGVYILYCLLPGVLI